MQTHRIMRQVLELHGCAEGDARRVQSELRDAYYRRLVPVIDKVCSELAGPGRIERIDRLEIELDDVPLEALESTLAERFERAFTGKLSAAIGGAPELDADFELLELFVRTGTVPWWADRSDAGLLASVVERLAGRSPRALKKVLMENREPGRKRVVLALPDRALERLAGALAPSLAGILEDLGTGWLESLPGSPLAARAARTLWWDEVVHALQIVGAEASGTDALFRAALARVARRLGMELGTLVQMLRAALDGKSPPARPATRDLVERLAAGSAARLAEAAVGRGRRVRAKGVDEASLSAPLDVLESVLAEIVSILRDVPARRGQGMANAERLVTRHAAVLKSLRSILGLPELPQPDVAGLDQWAFMLERLREIRRQPDHPRRPVAAQAPEAKKTVSGFSESDEIHLENAGLVILWPFLERFFDHVGLLEKKAFRGEAARQRAVGLLQYLATGEAPEAEYLLPLNKVLCGMALEEVFDFGEAMTEAEAEACEDLLAAAVAQAPILREMSNRGFRASFLLRKGQLGARDGNWLLRVERETHDVVLERFPWSFGMVRLPWMEALLQVQW